MKKELWWLLLGLGAILAKVLPTGNIGIAWAADQFAHRGTSFNNATFWVLLLILGIWLAADLVSRLRTGRQGTSFR
jgi:hypothetical protein